MSDTITIPARRGKAAYVSANQVIRVINTHGQQVVDTWAFNRHNISEFMSMEHSRSWLRRMIPLVGDSLVTNHRRRSPLEDHAEDILTVIEELPDLTLDEIVAVMRKRKIPGSRTALFRFLERRAVTSKKSPSRYRTGAGGRGSRPPAMDTRAGLA